MSGSTVGGEASGTEKRGRDMTRRADSQAGGQAKAVEEWAFEIAPLVNVAVSTTVTQGVAPHPEGGSTGPGIDLDQPPAKAGDDAVVPPATVKGVIDDRRLETLRKTFNLQKKESPDQAVLTLRGITKELDEAAAPLLPAAVAFRHEVMEGIVGLKAEVEAEVRRNVESWTTRIAALPRDAEAPPVSPEQVASQKALAESISGLVREIEPGIARQTKLLNAVGGDMSSLGTIESQFADLKARYVAMIPKRSTKADPKDAVAAAKPKIDLDAPKLKALNDLMSKMQGAMGAKQQVSADDVASAVSLIDEGLRSTDPQTILRTCKTWKTVKDTYRGTDTMNVLWWYRRKVVDKTMTDLQGKYGFTWGSVGSDNPESDYDLTIRTHGTKDGKPGGEVVWDFEIVKEANLLIVKNAGDGLKGPPGILFDTNLYAEAPPKKLESGQSPDPAMNATKENGQDVGALMKLRRFMEWDEYEDYKQKMLEGITDKAAKAAAVAQFDEADNTYFISRSEQILETIKKLETNTGLDDKEREEIETLKTKLATIDYSTTKGQKELEDLAVDLEHHEALSMETNNDIYVEKMKSVRDIEAKYDAEKDPAKKAALLADLKTAHTKATFFAAEAYHSEGALLHVVDANQSSKLSGEQEFNDGDRNPDAAIGKLQEAVDGEADPAKKKKLQDELARKTKYFNDLKLLKENLEATESADLKKKIESAIKKFRDDEKKKIIADKTDAAIGAITVSQMLQSFNENLGDLLKDLRHYGTEPFPGTGFYRSSKYIERLCDAAMELEKKVPPACKEALTGITLGGKTPKTMKDSMAKLVQIRGEKVDFKAALPDNPAAQEQERQAYSVQLMQDAFGSSVKTLPDLAKEISAFGQKVNAAVRNVAKPA